MQCVSLLRACHAAVGSAPHQLLHLLTVGVPDRLLRFFASAAYRNESQPRNRR